MPLGKDFEPDIETNADFLQARTALDGEDACIILDFRMLDFEPRTTTVGLVCGLHDVRRVASICLQALASFGDPTAAALLRMLDRRLDGEQANGD